jgi:hypothetical protein
MADIGAILTPEDKLEFAAWLSDRYAAKFVVDDHRPALDSVDFSALRSELIKDLPPVVFVLSDHWSSLPLYKQETTNQYKGQIHYVMQRYGGPAFMWAPGNRLPRREGHALAAGAFGDYAYYYVAPGSNETIPRPASMTAAFRAAQKWVRKLCEGRRTRYKETGTAGPWISARAWRLVTVGTAVLANDNLTISAADAA